MTWSDVAPTVPGIWWLREGHFAPAVVKVEDWRIVPTVPALVVRFLDSGQTKPMFETEGGLWSGPLTPPPEDRP